MTSSAVVGRDRELGLLGGMLDRLPLGGGVGVVWGPRGIGKSALLGRAAELARARQMSTLHVVGPESESGLPYAGLHQLIQQLRGETAVLPPVQYDVLTRAIDLAAGGAAPNRLAVDLALFELLSEIAASTPIVLLVDDADLVDDASYEAMAFAARRSSTVPLLAIGALRGPLRIAFAVAGLAELRLAPLDDESAEALLEQRRPGLPPGQRRQLLGLAAGNPLALVELASSVDGDAATVMTPADAPVNERLRRAFAIGWDDLDLPTRDAMLVAALSPDDDLDITLRACRLLTGDDASVDLVQPALDCGLATIDDARISFHHPLARAAVVLSATSSRRLRANDALSRVLDHPFWQAHYRAAATIGPDDGVAAALEQTAIAHLAAVGVPAVVRGLERAAALSTGADDRARRLLLAAEHAYLLGRADVVTRLVDSADPDAMTVIERARVENLRESTGGETASGAASVLEMCRLAREVQQAGDADVALDLVLAAALRCWRSDPDPATRRSVLDALAPGWSASPDARYVAVLAVTDPVSRAGDVRRLLRTPGVVDRSDADSLRFAGTAAYAVGDLPSARTLLGQATRRIRSEGGTGRLSLVTGLLADLQIESGDLAAAIASAREARRLAVDTGLPVWRTGADLTEAMACALAGRQDEAAQALAAAEASVVPRASVVVLRGVMMLASGRADSAFEALRRVFEPDGATPLDLRQASAVTFLAESAARSGQVDEARPLLSAVRAVAGASSSAVLAKHLAHAEAVLADDGEAEALFRAALDRDHGGWMWARGRLELAYGVWLRRQRRVVQSREMLHSARGAFEQMGALPWAERARQELRAAGDRDLPVDAGDEQTADGAVLLLSAQEVQIARLAAAGLSNREIGQRLFLSPRTVQSHLYRIFPKLGITARAQLTARLGDPRDER